jgi:2-C-methyl-D-erythritol 4-phosphate cytidylyltransferase/2-C-methyl-D-erythritol 2,4-cyclodiphosphate synthase
VAGGLSGRWLLLAAAGRGLRSGQAINKAFSPVAGVCPLLRCLAAFRESVDGAVVIIGADDGSLWSSIEPVARAILPIVVTTGGATRRESVARGLDKLPSSASWVAVHDAARPFVTRELIDRCFAQANETGAAIPATPITDTILQTSEEGGGIISRDKLRAVQTPQIFRVDLLRAAHAWAARIQADATDDAELVRRIGRTVALVEGDPANFKLTAPNDFAIAERILFQLEQPARSGFGMDAHRFAPDRALILCGVQVPHSLGLLGHSDADAAVHALIDALLGAACQGDIGRWFPDTDPAYKGISSIVLLEKVVGDLRVRGFTPLHADVTIAAQKPRLAPYIPRMRETLARSLGLSCDFVNVKATTTERMGYVGREEGIAAYAVATIQPHRLSG